MLEYAKQCIPLSINCVFAIICITFLQFLGQQIYLLITEIIILILGIFFHLLAIIKKNEKNIQINHSPIFFIILFLIQFGNLLYYSQMKISENLLCLLIGCMLSIQKIKLRDKEDKHKIQKIRTFLQSIIIFIIFMLFIIFRHQQDEIQFLILSALSIIIVFAMQVYLSQNNNKIMQNKNENENEIKEVVVEQQMKQSFNTQQLTVSSGLANWEKVLDQQIILISQRNNSDIQIDRISQYLHQYLKDKNYVIEEYLKKITLFQTQYESENILSNNMIEVKGSLFIYLKELLTEEKQSAAGKRRRSKEVQLDEPQKQLFSPNESRSRLQSVSRNEQLQKANTLNLNNLSIYYVSDNTPLSNSIKELCQLKPTTSEPTSPQNSKKTKLFGFIQGEKQIYKNITITNLNDKSYLIDIEDDSVDTIKSQTNNIVIAYRYSVTQNKIQELLRMSQELTSSFNVAIRNNQQDTRELQQISAKIFLQEIWSLNFIYFLQDGQQKLNFQSFNVLNFIKSLIHKINSEKSVQENLISFKVFEENLKEKIISTDVYCFRQIIINLLLNSIKSYRRPDPQNCIQIKISQKSVDDIKFEVIDYGSGFSAPLDCKRVKDGKLGIFIIQKLLPQIVKNPKIFFKTIYSDIQKRGTSVSFCMNRNFNPNSNSIHSQSMNVIQQESVRLAQIQCQQLNYNNQNEI